jgi:signal transduction histidine kinase
LERFVERIHADDRGMCIEALEAGIREATTVEVEYRVVLPQGPVRRHRAIAHPVVTASGDVAEIVGTIEDVTDRRRAEAELERLAGEQAALRRVATLVARKASQSEVFTAIAEGIGQLLGTEEIRMLRYEDDHSAVVVAGTGEIDDALPIGSRQPLGGENAASRVFRTALPARIDDYGTASGAISAAVRPIGVRSVVAAPILVEGRLWGAMATATSRHERLPPETESRLGQFTELMATAIANTESHAKANRLTDEQAALRRVATLVARGTRPEQVFAAVADEIAQLLSVDLANVCRYESDGTITFLASAGEGIPVGGRWPLGERNLAALVLETGRPARRDDYADATGPLVERSRELGFRSAVGMPIIVESRLWGVIAVGRSGEQPLPPDTEARLGSFTDLLGTAIANADARAEVERLAEEQAALRRVAMLVAEGAPPTSVFEAVAAEMERLLDADGVTVSRYEPADELTVVAHHGSNASRVPPGTRVRAEAESVTATIRRTERPARLEQYEGSDGPIAQLVHTLGVRAAVGAPIVVDGRLWGSIIATWKGEESPPSDTEERMAQFAQLLDTAIANADSRDQLDASRARLLTEADAARRRVVRDLHDGAQQRLVHAIISLQLAQQAFRENAGDAESLLGEALEHARQGNAALRELAHGILPAILTHGGLPAGIEAVVSRLNLPVEVDVPAQRFPAQIEASAYFIIAEALTNVVKHAGARHAEVRASAQNGTLDIEVRDDGSGGADPDGHGLVGVRDRVTALGGRLKIESPPGGGTLVAATLPLSGG